MDQTTSQDTQEFLSGVANELDAQASKMEAANGAVDTGASCKTGRRIDAQFASKMVYTACYTLSYGICFPIFAVCRYIPKNNELVNGLIDGGVSANHSVDEMMERAKKWRLARCDAAEHAEEEAEMMDSGADALASA